jgi:hypothetical protein
VLFWNRRSDRESHLEAIDPLGLGNAATEGGQSSEEPLAACSHPHHCRDQGGVEYMVDLRVLGESLGHTPLKPPEFGFQSTDSTIELALAQQVREVVAKVGVGEPPEVPLTAETRPLSEGGEHQNLALGERASGGRALPVPTRGFPQPIIHENVQRDQ